jgi:hypothetical protein
MVQVLPFVPARALQVPVSARAQPQTPFLHWAFDEQTWASSRRGAQSLSLHPVGQVV